MHDSKYIQSSMLSIREKIADAVIYFSAFLSIPLIIILWLRFRESGISVILIAHLLCLCAMWAVFFLRAKLSYVVKGAVVPCLLVVTAIFGFMHYGISSAGGMLLLTAVIACTLTYGRRGSIVALIISIAVIGAFTFAIVNKWLVFNVDFNAYNIAQTSWIIQFIVVLVMPGAIIVMADMLYTSLVNALDTANERADRLHGITRELEEEVEQRREAEERLRASLQEKETLIRELYHRTRNNMQIISSIVKLSSEKVRDPSVNSVLDEINTRILAMSLVHQKLYESRDLSHINLKDYIVDLVQQIKRPHAAVCEHVTVVMEVQDSEVLVDTAIQCGLLLNELLSNALKHAFPGGRQGTVTVRLHNTADDEIELSVADDGIGLPHGINLTSIASIGLRTVLMFLENQAKGTLTCETEHGLSCTVRFKKSAYRQRV